MMQANLVDKAERAARSRAALLAIGAVVVAVTAFLRTTDTSPGAEGLGWILLMAAWSLVLATGGGLALNRQMRALLNDELATANRSRALSWGFFAGLLAGAIVLLVAPHIALDPAGAVRIVTAAGLSVAMARYAMLEW
jgi:phosphoserine phosphatase